MPINETWFYTPPYTELMGGVTDNKWGLSSFCRLY